MMMMMMVIIIIIIIIIISLRRQRTDNVNLFLFLLLNWSKNFSDYKSTTLASHLRYYEGYKVNPTESLGADYQHNAHIKQRITQMYKTLTARETNSEKFFDYKDYSSHFKKVTEFRKFSKKSDASFVTVYYTERLFSSHYRVKNILFRNLAKRLARLSETTFITLFIPYPTAFPYGNVMVLHFYQQQESSMTKTVHKVINKGLKAYV